MTIHERTYGRKNAGVVNDVMFSADSHVIEPAGLWARELPASLRDRAPKLGGRRGSDQEGAMEKDLRVQEMARDGVVGEVLYPTHALRVLGLDDVELEEACCRVYNDWLMVYCSAAPDRLIGLALISMYNIDHAIEELERCRNGGLKGSTIWQVPDPELPWLSDHYERFWAASQDLEMPVGLHILSGFGYSRARGSSGTNAGELTGRSLAEQQRTSVNVKLIQSVNTLYDFIFGGALDRYPRMKLVLAENEIGWLPFVLEQWDYYYLRHGENKSADEKMSRMPTEYFHDQVYATFFNDAVGGHLLSWWGEDNCMWSSDYPHGNTTWPNSREIVARDLGLMPEEIRGKLVRGNVARLYDIAVPEPITVSAVQ